jgi:DNA-binding NarL/FixJ family response regulator
MKRGNAKPRARVLIVDDHPAVREALALRIGRQPDLQVCGEATEPGEALRLVGETRPDVAVIDISLKSGNGIDLIKRIKDRADRVRMVVWSMHSESLYAERALRAGAMGYVNKDQATDTIVEAIRRVLDGKIWLSPLMTERMLQRTVGAGRMRVTQSPVDNLSDRELEAFQLIAHGRTTEQIATAMHVSPKTVETFRARIKEKLGLSNVSELVRYAAQWAIENAAPNATD